MPIAVVDEGASTWFYDASSPVGRWTLPLSAFRDAASILGDTTKRSGDGRDVGGDDGDGDGVAGATGAAGAAGASNDEKSISVAASAGNGQCTGRTPICEQRRLNRPHS